MSETKARLTARGEYAGFAYFPKCFEEPCFGNGCGEHREKCCFLDDVCERLCELEKKLACGALLEPPVKIGDEVYAVLGDCDWDEPIVRYEVCGLSYKGGAWYVIDHSMCEEFLVGGDLCRLTLEEAEERLAEKRREKGGSPLC